MAECLCSTHAGRSTDMRRLLPVLLVTFACAAALPAATQTVSLRYQVIELPLVTGAKDGQATAINNSGQVVGVTPDSSSGSKSFTGWLWTPATAATAARIQTLAPLPGFP